MEIVEDVDAQVGGSSTRCAAASAVRYDRDLHQRERREWLRETRRLPSQGHPREAASECPRCFDAGGVAGRRRSPQDRHHDGDLFDDDRDAEGIDDGERRGDRPPADARGTTLPIERTFFWRAVYAGRQQRAARSGPWKAMLDGGMQMLFDVTRRTPVSATKTWRSSIRKSSPTRSQGADRGVGKGRRHGSRGVRPGAALTSPAPGLRWWPAAAIALASAAALAWVWLPEGRDGQSIGSCAPSRSRSRRCCSSRSG